MARTKNVPTAAEEAIHAAIAAYEAAIPAALEARDAEIRRIADEHDLKQIDVIRITGYSRETVRQALDPKIRSAMRKAAEERRAAKEPK
jgi:phosphoenolpyruvate synthase/pyruvate phosphate dikinase